MPNLLNEYRWSAPPEVLTRRAIALLLALACHLSPVPARGQNGDPALPLITEFQADNQGSLADEDGDFPSWIELHFPGTNAFNLEGWHLTDDPLQLAKWRFPSVSISARGFLVVFASGKNRTLAAGRLHTNFKLNPSGEYLALVRPDGVTVASQFGASYPGQFPGRSYGLEMRGVLEALPVPLPVDPASLFPYVHLRADAGVTTNATANQVTAWLDQSTNGFVFRANHPRATGNDPEVVSGPRTGTFALNFDGSDLLDSDADLQLFTEPNSAFTVILVLKPYSVTGAQRFVMTHSPGVGGDSFELGQDAGQVATPAAWGLHRGSGQATSTEPRALVANQYRVLTTEVLAGGDSGQNIRFLTNGVLVPNGVGNWLNAGSYNTGSDPLAIGARIDNHRNGFDTLAPNSGFIGDLAELLLFRAALTTEERQGVEQFLLNRYALPAPVRTVVRPELVAGRTGYFLRPTPGALNGVPVAGLVSDTRFEPNRGFFESNVVVTLRCDTPDAVIRYTTNSSAPTAATGWIYTGPVTLDRTTVLRAAAFKEGFEPSDVDTQTYFFLDDVLGQPKRPAGFPASFGSGAADYEMDPEVVTNQVYGPLMKPALLAIPTLSLVTDRSNLWDNVRGIYSHADSRGDAWERPVSLEYLDPRTGEQFQANAGIRIHGGVSRGGVKQSFNIHFRGSYGLPTLVYPLFEGNRVQRFDSLTLRGQWNDGWNHTSDNNLSAVYVRDEWARRTFTAMGGLTAVGGYLQVYLDGLYWGLYNPVEHINAAFVAEHLGGEEEDYDVVKFNGGPTVEDGDLKSWSQLMKLAETALTTEAAYQKIQQSLDLDDLIDFMMLFVFIGNEDGPAKNYYSYFDRRPGGRWRFVSWDNEWALGHSFSGLDKLDVDVSSVSVPDTATWLYGKLRLNAEFRLRFADRVQQHFFNNGPLAPATGIQLYSKLITTITNAVIGESARWGDVNNVQAPGHPYTRDKEWAAENAFMLQTYFNRRHGIVLQQFRALRLYPTVGAPLFSHFGGEISADFQLSLSHTNSTGTLFFTLNGTDPRAYGTGEVAPDAQAYSEPLRFGATIEVRARTLVGTNWSALVRATFYPPQDLSGLRMTELMYHPAAAGTVDGDEFEFIELKNAGTRSLNLGGLAFSQGIGFSFTNGTLLPPGAFWVLARNAQRFASRYGGAPPNGVYSGKLDNSGERLVLSTASGSPLREWTYQTRAPWPTLPDGFGFSLVPKNPGSASNQDAGSAQSWRASASPGGSPGREDPEPEVPVVLINEVLSNSEGGQLDAVELYNPGEVPIDLAGWFLSDDPLEPTKYGIPPNTVIAAKGYRVLTEVDFNPAPVSGTGFAFSAYGDQVYLFSGDSQSQLTGYGHGFLFGAASAGATFGRLLISTGEDRFPLQPTGTLGSVNSGPHVGPVILTEIQYHPDATDEEFIELKNLTSQPIPLYDPRHPTNTWQIAGAGFSFPTNQVLGPNQTALVVAGDPESFRSAYSIGSDVLIFGPLAGRLQDGGERLSLERPEELDAGRIAYLTVDEVSYGDKSPWPPSADGSGPSLQRRFDATFGDDPASWLAASPTPGRPYLSGVFPTLVQQPQPTLSKPHETVTFTVAAEGPGPVHYQWRFQGRPIAGATGPSLTLTDLQASQAGHYSVVVFNAAGSVSSLDAELVMLLPPLVVAQPRDLSVKAGGTGVFVVAGRSFGPIQYQWRFNDQDLAGATNAILTLTNVQTRQEGFYTVRLADVFGSTWSEPARLTILVVPTILIQPLPQAVVPGGTASFSVAASGTLPLSYRWRRGTVTVTNQTLFSSNSILTVRNVSAGSAGAWSVVVTNAAGTVTSANTVLTLVSDADGDGISDAWETAHGLNPTDPGDAQGDPDRDGMSTAEEYRAGTDPRDPRSVLRLDAFAEDLGIRLEFSAGSNRTYSIWSSEDLNSSAWAKWGDIVAEPTDGLRRAREIRLNPPHRYYRLLTPAE